MLTPGDIIRMNDTELGRYASGGFGVQKRVEFLALIREMAVNVTLAAKPAFGRRLTSFLGDPPEGPRAA